MVMAKGLDSFDDARFVVGESKQEEAKDMVVFSMDRSMKAISQFRTVQGTTQVSPNEIAPRFDSVRAIRLA